MDIFIPKGKPIVVASVPSFQVLADRLGGKITDSLPRKKAVLVNSNFPLISRATIAKIAGKSPPFALVSGGSIAALVLQDASKFKGFELAKKSNTEPLVTEPLATEPLASDEAVNISTTRQRAVAEQRLQQLLAQKHSGKVFFHNVATTHLGWDTKFGKNVEVGIGVWFGSKVVVKANAEILSFCHLEDCTIGSNARIGPFAHIRANTRIASQAFVGAFVQTKNTTVGSGTKIPHLSYVGDATLGKQVNVGAGSIFCNYDGASKHKTTVGDNSFIGSNNSIVAPLRLGKNVKTAAGSTITDSAGDNTLVMARSPQVTKQVAKATSKGAGKTQPAGKTAGKATSGKTPNKNTGKSKTKRGQ